MTATVNVDWNEDTFVAIAYYAKYCLICLVCVGASGANGTCMCDSFKGLAVGTGECTPNETMHTLSSKHYGNR